MSKSPRGRRMAPPFFASENEHPFTDAQASSAKSPQSQDKARPSVPRKGRVRKSNATLLPGIVRGERVLVAQLPAKESETALKKRIRVALAASGALAWNNPIGLAKMPSGGWVEFGLCEGSADLVGIVKVAGGIGRFFGVEVKVPKTGRIRDAQERWAAVVRRWGGYVCFARSVEDAMTGFRECQAGVLQ